MFSLKNKIAIITGGCGGIGKAIVKAYKKAGATVWNFDTKNGNDITLYNSMADWIDIIYKNHKRIDILVNNAAVNSNHTYDEEEWDKLIEVNLKAPFMLSKMVKPYMKRGGSIINITSLWSEVAFNNNPAYGASKGGLKQLTKCLAVDFAKDNIRVNNLGFGYIKTIMTKYSWNNKSKRNKITKKIPLGRWGNVKDVVGSAIFLASDASKYITGQSLYVDGGFLAKGI